LRAVIGPLRDTPFRLSALCLMATAALGALWDTPLLPSGTLTAGRLALAATSVALLIDVWRAPRPLGAPPPLARVLAIASSLLGLWIMLSDIGWGCRCGGSALAYAELLTLLLLALAVMSVEPRTRLPLLIAAATGSVIAATVALAGIGPLNSDVTSAGGRAAGTFGNANELGYAVAFGLPLLIALPAPPTRLLAIVRGGSLLVIGLAILLSFSRSAVVAAAAGTLAVLLLRAESARGRRLLIAGAAGALLLALGTYPLFERLREDANFAPVSETLRALDRSGWDGSINAMPSGPSSFSTARAGSLAVEASRSAEGVSYPFGRAIPDRTYLLQFEARAAEGTIPLAYGMKDQAIGNGPRVRTAIVGTDWRALALRWRPIERSKDARLYIWQNGGTASFFIRSLVVSERRGARAPTVVRRPPTVLEGSMYEHVKAQIDSKPEVDQESREEALSAGFAAFFSAPVTGIGWDDFPSFAGQRSRFGELATHNEYLRIAAELGIVGLVLMALLGGTLLYAIRSAPACSVDIAAIGALTVGAVAQFFVNGIVLQAASLPLAVSMAVLCTAGVRDARGTAGAGRRPLLSLRG
jgi:hypothetical protein